MAIQVSGGEYRDLLTAQLLEVRGLADRHRLRFELDAMPRSRRRHDRRLPYGAALLTAGGQTVYVTVPSVYPGEVLLDSLRFLRGWITL